MTVTIPIHASKIISQLHELGDILNIEYDDSSAIIDLEANMENAKRIERLVAFDG